MQEKNYIEKDFQLVGVYKKDGVFKTEDGREITYKNYYVEIKDPYTGLIIRAKVDKVFNDYVEDTEDGRE